MTRITIPVTIEFDLGTPLDGRTSNRLQGRLQEKLAEAAADACAQLDIPAVPDVIVDDLDQVEDEERVYHD